MAGEKRLIDANVAGKTILIAEENVRSSIGCGYDEGFADALDSVADIIKRMQTVDAVEVVRCKDCKSYDPGYIRQDHGWCKEWGTAVRAGGFCHHGERKAEYDN